MAGSQVDLTQLELIREADLSEQEVYVLYALSWAMQSPTWEAAEGSAYLLDELCPPLEQEEEATDYLWLVWALICKIAESPDVSFEVHKQLVKVLQSVAQCAKGNLRVWGVSIIETTPIELLVININLQSSTRMWRDLPLLASCMDAHFFGESQGFFILSKVLVLTCHIRPYSGRGTGGVYTKVSTEVAELQLLCGSMHRSGCGRFMDSGIGSFASSTGG